MSGLHWVLENHEPALFLGMCSLVWQMRSHRTLIDVLRASGEIAASVIKFTHSLSVTSSEAGDIVPRWRRAYRPAVALETIHE